MINDKIQVRTVGLIGKENLEKIRKIKIAIFGLGGVGGTSLVSLVRSGFLNFFLVDFDRVDFSNLNRQILFSEEDEGQLKVDLAASFLGRLTDGVKLSTSSSKVSKENIDELLDSQNVDFIVDAIDDIKGKMAIISYAIKHDIPFITSLGMGNRIDPRKVDIMTLNKTSYDPLARRIRTECRKEGINLKKVVTVCSKEIPLLKSPKPFSMMMVPSSAGLTICYYIIEHFLILEKEKRN
jgi:tRNA A37 threonylcarbamoyladenosine dehydratase